MQTLDLSKHLKKNKNGIWQSSEKNELSYPSEGNSNCLKLEEKSFWFRHRNRCLLKVIKDFPSQGPILDIGSGTGYQAEFLQKKGINMICLEPGEQGAFYAKNRGIKEVINATFSDCKFEENSLNACSMFDVLEHVEDDLALLKDVQKCLKKSGRFYLTVPAYNFLWSQDDEFAGHYRRYTLSSLNKVFTSAGFRLIYKSYIFSYLPPLAFALRAIPYRLGLRKNFDDTKHEKDHAANESFSSRVLNACSKLEYSIFKRRRLPFGGSCLIVAEKI